MLDAQMKRGLIENCVLAALARGDSYGYQIVKDLSSVVAVTESTLYPILRRLESAGSGLRKAQRSGERFLCALSRRSDCRRRGDTRHLRCVNGAVCTASG